MAPRKRPRPDLDHCVQSLSKLQTVTVNPAPKELAETYLAGLGLLYHLQLDQAVIKETRQLHSGKDIPFPKFSSIPAISAVVHKQVLFRALVSCLSLSGSGSDTQVSELPGRFHQQMQPGSRKRTASLDSGHLAGDAPVPKSIKISHSPQVAKRSNSYAKPKMNIRVLASTIIFVAFEHLDHWPAPLVKAYSEDCFGPRSWVDEPSCHLLVKNLELCHSNDEMKDESVVDCNHESDGATLASFYTKTSVSENLAHVDPTISPVGRRGSLSSVASHSSSGEPKSTRPRSMSTDSSVDNGLKSSNHSKTHFSSPPVKMKPSTKFRADESDSADEEAMAMPALTSKLFDDGGDSSSSGEEDEEVVLTSKSFAGDDKDSTRPSPPSKESDLPQPVERSYPIQQRNLSFIRIRQRYFGLNLEQAHLAISSSLAERLDTRTKQNSGLLQTLPRFASIPTIRRQITANLEKWLQSPALAGLARSLFSQTVSLMKNVDPPLPPDLEAIDNILAMKLKANQLNAHVDNITAIAKRIPTAAVSRHIYYRLLREVLLSMDSTDMTSADHLKMIHAVNGILSGALTADGMAAALTKLLVQRPDVLSEMSSAAYTRRLCGLIREIGKQLGTNLNACQLLDVFVSMPIEGVASWTKADEENRGRLIFQCVSLVVEDQGGSEHRPPGQRISVQELGADKLQSLKTRLAHARKTILRWCCTDYAHFLSEGEINGVRGDAKKSRDKIIGAGPTDYTSVLDGINNEVFSEWIDVLRSVLFLEDPQSSRLQRFLAPDGVSVEKTPEWRDESNKMRLCYDHGADVDDEMVWIVLKAVTAKADSTTPQIALEVLEHLFSGCSKNQHGKLLLTDARILWALYTIVEYTPADRVGIGGNGHSDAKDAEIQDARSKDNRANSSEELLLEQDIPNLAYPGMWWRVTGLALVMCGASPERIGSIAWNEHPTLRALIKMVTSDRYRFPTVDCDDAARDEMKKTEQTMRDDEGRITEILFLPKKPKKKTENTAIESSFGGSRASRRQKEKRERMLKRQQENQVTEALKEANRRKKTLRTAQKSIMLWDPKRGPRKPPKESADLIFSVGELFDLPRIFQRVINPDFLLMTIGNTTRGAIERAYDWLIPIISCVPESITRLPASASCFLLLRAYGTEGEERMQLQELSAPLLVHVRQSLTGAFGELDAIRAFDLLLADVASHNPDRRRCARRVLHDAIGKEEYGEIPDALSNSNCSWMVNLMHLEYARSVVLDSIKHLVRAASFERGRVLRYLVLSLKKLTDYAQEHAILGSFSFPSELVELISCRPTVFAATLGSFSDLRSLAIDVVHYEFAKYTETLRYKKSYTEMKDACDIVLCCKPSSEAYDEPVKVTLPLSLLESSCVLLSIWHEESKDVDGSNAVESLVRMLMRSTEGRAGCNSIIEEDGIVDGLASARLVTTENSAIPVESWVMLARSRTDYIAKRAASAAPNGFLPRLLLCSGLPRASLLSMIDRLGKLGDRAADRDKVFTQLLIPSATSEWDIGRLGRRKEISRKLMGRLSAYSQMYAINDLEGDQLVSFTFLEWLSKSYQDSGKPPNKRPKKEKGPQSKRISRIESVEQLLDRMADETLQEFQESNLKLDGNASNMTCFLGLEIDYPRIEEPSQITNGTISSLKSILESNRTDHLESWLDERFTHSPTSKKQSKGRWATNQVGSRGAEISYILLKTFTDLDRKTEGLGACLVKWVPKLSAQTGSAELWKLLLADRNKPRFMWSNLVSRCCQAWCHTHLVSCRKWILSSVKDTDLDQAKAVRVLVHSSSLNSIYVESFVDSPLHSLDASWGHSGDSVRSATWLALESLMASDADFLEGQLRGRNDPPDGLVLLLLIARMGRKQLEVASRAVVERMDKTDSENHAILLAVILRLYASFPNHMNLGVAILRSVLKEAVEKYSIEWVSWRSPMDDQFEDIVFAIALDGAPPRMVQALTEGAKKHPLLLLRKIITIEQLLEKDATVREVSVANEKRGVIYGQNLTGSLPAKADGKLMMVILRHWGFNYTESIWIAFLDVISAVPNEVLFGCGMKMGLDCFLGVYLRLMSVQTQLRNGDRLGSLKSKMSELFGTFKHSNIAGWESWIKQEVPGLSSLGSTRNVLMSCDFISHQEAIASVKKSHETNV